MRAGFNRVSSGKGMQFSSSISTDGILPSLTAPVEFSSSIGEVPECIGKFSDVSDSLTFELDDDSDCTASSINEHSLRSASPTLRSSKLLIAGLSVLTHNRDKTSGPWSSGNEHCNIK
ncbi:hypothetical protein M514_18754, partial [Trichuris suis]